ncbi:Hypothetical predicted protein [Olea europaea subsp. europaea]|uniref:Uncharacterized protein n=1 Tax=Olea europaea subsp. europaea TaxID=158383 RepID=A0A8S0RAC9_OLEEU|nr:Hypothetical predicted protein [Olea europaea subsp. europaea]
MGGREHARACFTLSARVPHQGRQRRRRLSPAASGFCSQQKHERGHAISRRQAARFPAASLDSSQSLSLSLLSRSRSRFGSGQACEGSSLRLARVHNSSSSSSSSSCELALDEANQARVGEESPTRDAKAAPVEETRPGGLRKSATADGAKSALWAHYCFILCPAEGAKSGPASAGPACAPASASGWPHAGRAQIMAHLRQLFHAPPPLMGNIRRRGHTHAPGDLVPAEGGRTDRGRRWAAADEGRRPMGRNEKWRATRAPSRVLFQVSRGGPAAAAL